MKLKKKVILFLEGMLSKTEEEKLRNEIKDDPDIQKFIQNYSRIEEGLRAYLLSKGIPEDKNTTREDLDEMAQSDISQYLIDYDKNYSLKEENFLKRIREISAGPEKKTRKLGLMLNIAASVAFVILIAMGIIHFIKRDQLLNFNSALFTENFQPWNDEYLKQMNSSYVILDRNELSLTDKGETLNKKSLNSVLRDGEMEQEDILMIALLLIQKDELDIATEYLADIIEKSNENLIPSARWYLSLLEIKRGRLNDARSNLQILCQDNRQYGNKSCQLLATLDKKNLN